MNKNVFNSIGVIPLAFVVIALLADFLLESAHRTIKRPSQDGTAFSFLGVVLDQFLISRADHRTVNY